MRSSSQYVFRFLATPDNDGIQWFASAPTDTEEAKRGGHPKDLLPNVRKALSERVSCMLFTLRVFPAVGNSMLPGKAAKFSVSKVKGYQDESVEEVLEVGRIFYRPDITNIVKRARTGHINSPSPWPPGRGENLKQRQLETASVSTHSCSRRLRTTDDTKCLFFFVSSSQYMWLRFNYAASVT